MIPYHKSLGITIKSHNYGETAKLITIFTKEFGRLNAIAKGARKSKSRFASSLELFTEAEFMFYRKPGAELYLVTQADTKKVFRKLTEDVKKFVFASTISEFIYAFKEPGEYDPEIYRLFKETLYEIDKNTGEDRTAAAFMLKFLHLSGYGLSLEKCSSCNSEFKPGLNSHLSIKSGGYLCEKCSEKHHGKVSVPGKTIKTMQFMVKNDYNRLKSLVIDKEVKTEIERIVTSFTEYNFGAGVKSFGVNESLKKYGVLN